jgi:hypothetical protein
MRFGFYSLLLVLEMLRFGQWIDYLLSLLVWAEGAGASACVPVAGRMPALQLLAGGTPAVQWL